jgi:hypothetical protein
VAPESGGWGFNDRRSTFMNWDICMLLLHSWYSSNFPTIMAESSSTLHACTLSCYYYSLLSQITQTPKFFSPKQHYLECNITEKSTWRAFWKTRLYFAQTVEIDCRVLQDTAEPEQKIVLGKLC